MRKDGTCAVCRKLIETLPRPGVPPLLYVDPFCSAVCARAYYNVELSPPDTKGRKRFYVESEGAAPK